MFKYCLCFGLVRIFLFESQFQFLSESQCLRHYERGLSKDLFSFDRARINQVWSELGLWGLIGRICPVDLVRILCAFGSKVERSLNAEDSVELTKSFLPVTYSVVISSLDQTRFSQLLHLKLKNESSDEISLFLEQSDKIILGSYYTTTTQDADSQLPVFSSLFEKDLCLKTGYIRQTLSELLSQGFRIVAEVETQTIILADYRDGSVISGFGAEETLFFISDAA